MDQFFLIWSLKISQIWKEPILQKLTYVIFFLEKQNNVKIFKGITDLQQVQEIREKTWRSSNLSDKKSYGNLGKKLHFSDPIYESIRNSIKKEDLLKEMDFEEITFSRILESSLKSSKPQKEIPSKENAGRESSHSKGKTSPGKGEANNEEQVKSENFCK